MARDERRQNFAFLYRTERGAVDAEIWARAAVRLAAVFAVLAIAVAFLRPLAARSLNERALFDPLSLLANLFLLACIFAAILLAVSWVNLSAKRFRDRGHALPVGLAGVLPFVVLLDGALRWVQPRAADLFPPWVVYVGDAAVLGTLGWTVAACGDFLRRPG